jgi:hypothetical protein
LEMTMWRTEKAMVEWAVSKVQIWVAMGFLGGGRVAGWLCLRR